MINDQIHELFEANRHLFKGQPISFDGVVDEASYLSSTIRTAFLLKDINGEEIFEDNGIKVTRIMQNDWEYMADLRKDILDPNKSLYKTWPNACLWIELLKNPNCKYSECLTANESFNEAKLRNNLLSVAIINLKKTPGRGSSIHAEIIEAVDYGRKLLKDQIDIINPQLIICGGTFEYAERLFDIKENQLKMLPCGAHYFVVNGRIYLEFVHPIWYTVNRRILFSYAKEVFSDLRDGIIY